MINPQNGLAILTLFGSLSFAQSTSAAMLNLPPFSPPLGRQGPVIMQPVSIETNMGTTAGAIGQIIDQSGLVNQQEAPNPYQSCQTRFPSYMNETLHSPTSTAGWRSAISSPTGIITFGMGCPSEPIVGIGLWQASTIEPGRQVKDFNLYADNDADFSNGTLSLIENFTAQQTVGAPTPGQVGQFYTNWVPYIHMEIVSNYGDETSTALGEVSFASVPEPITLLGAGTAVGIGTFFKRRSRKKA